MRYTPIGSARARDTQPEALGPPEHKTTTNHIIAYRHLDDSGCGCNKPQQKDQALMTLTYKHNYSVLLKEIGFPANAARSTP